MGKEYNDMKKKATRFMLQELSNGTGMTIDQMKRKADFEFGLGEKWVLNFLDLYEAGLSEEDGVFRWKA